MMEGKLHMRKSTSWAEWAIVGVWVLPPIQPYMLLFFKGLFALTGYTELVFNFGYLFAIFGLWCWLVSIFKNHELTRAKLDIFNHSTFVTYEGKSYVMTPCDLDEIRRVGEENRTFKEVMRGDAA